jgi:hypothetical protein
MTKIEVTKELMVNITNAVRAWQKYTVPLEDEDQHFDTFCEDMYGLKIEFFTVDNSVHVAGAEVVDEEKYMNFLLTFGMPNE